MIVTEYMQGGSLKQFIRQNNLSMKKVSSIMRDIASGMNQLAMQKIGIYQVEFQVENNCKKRFIQNQRSATISS